MKVHPQDLIGDDGRPRPLKAEQRRASEIANSYDLKFEGEDLPVTSPGPLSKLSGDDHSGFLTYLVSADFAGDLKHAEGITVISQPHLREFIPGGNAVLLGDKDPKEMFYTILSEMVEQGLFESLPENIHSSATVESSAVIGKNVFIDEGAVIGHGSVILPNSYIGPNVIIKPNATVGGDGFELSTIKGHQRIVPHAGGAWLSEYVAIGSSTCVDKGLYGDFTLLGAYTKVDNLVQIGHSIRVGSHCAITACCEPGGSTVLGDGIWLGPNVTINQGLNIGDYCYVGTGSVITRDLPSYALAYGVPAKVKGWVCQCRTKLTFVEGNASCSKCGNQFKQISEGTVQLINQ